MEQLLNELGIFIEVGGLLRLMANVGSDSVIRTPITGVKHSFTGPL